jgi:hypothetical protein
MTKEEHLLVILSEECSEVIKEVSKALRFGLLDIEPGQPDTNYKKIQYELNDLYAIVELLHEKKIISLDFNRVLIEKKKIKMLKWLEYSHSVNKTTYDHIEKLSDDDATAF